MMRKALVGFSAVAVGLVLASTAIATHGKPHRPTGFPAALIALVRHDDSLLDRAGVTAAGIGQDASGRAVIRVYLERSGVTLPGEIDGVPVVAHISGRVYARSDPTARFPRPVPIGVSVGHPAITAGTLGARVRDGAGNVFVLSNNHVLANENAAFAGDPILQPGSFDGGALPADAIGSLADFQPISFASGTTNTMDAALAATTTVQVGTATPEDGYGAPASTVAPASAGLAVKKFGRTTKLTSGQIEAVNVTVDVCYESSAFFCTKSARFVNQVSITPGTFSSGGDSGSLIVTQSGNQPVALLFAGSSARTYATPIGTVLTRFGITIDTGGPPGNAAPTVSAGPDLGTTLPADTVALDGTVSDDGLPGPALATSWSAVSGPGTVTFGDAGAVDTSATFSAAGVYVLELHADDSALQAADTVTVTVSPAPGATSLYASLGADGAAGSLAAANEDVLAFDGASFTLAFDGSDVGLAGLAIDAVAFLGPNQLLLSFTAAGTVPDVGSVDDSDVVRFTGTLGGATSGTFAMHFDGSDVGLTTNDEDVDALEVLTDGRIAISTLGSVSVPGAAGADEDVVAFAPTSLGATTTGAWSILFDGSDVGLGGTSEDVDAVAQDAAGRLHLSTADGFTVPGVSGADEDVVVFTPATLGAATSGAWGPGLAFDGSAFGLSANDVSAIDLP